MSLQSAEQAVREGDLDAALRDLQEQVKKNPAAANLRVFLFQLLVVRGEWQRAHTQLDVAADLDAGTLAMAQMYREAIRCEVIRRDVFAGRRSPLIFGEPPQWLALLIESLLAAGAGRQADAQSLHDRAFDDAPASSGTIDGEAFEWIADADMRIGPVCEAIINGRYYWLPFARLSKIAIEPPADLRDLVWTPAHFEFANGGDSVGLIPTRYPGSEASDDTGICLARKTTWVEGEGGVFHGLGQRLLTTDGGEHALLDTRMIEITAATADGGESAPEHG